MVLSLFDINASSTSIELRFFSFLAHADPAPLFLRLPISYPYGSQGPKVTDTVYFDIGSFTS
jgi:hypothetical protein